MNRRKEGRLLGGSLLHTTLDGDIEGSGWDGPGDLGHCLVASELGLLPGEFGHEWPRPYTCCLKTGRPTAFCVSLVGAHYWPLPLGLGSAPPFLRAFGEPC